MNRYWIEIIDDLLCLLDSRNCSVDVAEIRSAEQAARVVAAWRAEYAIANAHDAIAEVREYLEVA